MGTEPKTDSSPRGDPSATLLFYDGVCGLCHWLTRFVLRHDTRARFRFAPLQGSLAKSVLARHGQDAEAVDTVVLVTDYGRPGEATLTRSRAVLRVFFELGGAFRLVAPLTLLPTSWLDWGYDFVARRRYRWFGQVDQCVLPSPEERARFLEEP